VSAWVTTHNIRVTLEVPTKLMAAGLRGRYTRDANRHRTVTNSIRAGEVQMSEFCLDSDAADGGAAHPHSTADTRGRVPSTSTTRIL